MKKKDVVKFARLLYGNYLDYVIEFEVNNKLKLWYNISNYQGWDKPDNFNEVLSDYCILQEQTNLIYLFLNSPITHFDIDLLNVKNTRFMFEKCKDLIYFNSKMTNVKDTYCMFKGCSDKFFQNHPHLRDL